jgi:hypothetical protein
MSDPVTQNVPTHNAPLRRAASKDLSLVSLVPKWSGGETALPINEFFEIIEGSAAIGNWTEPDQKQVCALKLTDAARAFYSATLELRDPTITWQDFKARFLQRFRDVRSAQYHFGQLYMARQRKEETAQEFLDRCRLFAKRTVPCRTDPVLQQAYNEQAEQLLLSTFSKGLLGIAGRHVRFTSPATAEEALRIAVTVSQAEIQEARDSAFYLDTEVADITPAGRVREPAVRHTAARQSAGSAAQPRKPSREGQRRPSERASTSKGQPDKPVKSYECSGYGDCANRRQRQTATQPRTSNLESARERSTNHPHVLGTTEQQMDVMTAPAICTSRKTLRATMRAS